MSVVAPWHSIESNVYHENTECLDGSQIVAYHVREGKGNHRLCKECEKISNKAHREVIDGLMGVARGFSPLAFMKK